MRRAQATLELAVLLGLVVLVGAVVATAARADGAGWARRLAAALPGERPERRDDRWALRSDRYGPLLRRYAPTLVLERDRWGEDTAVPVDVAVCRRPACAALGTGLPVAFTHVVDRPGVTYLQYWFYYPDSRTTHAPLKGLQGHHPDDWEGVIVRIADDGEVGVRVTAHQGLVGARAWWSGDPGWYPPAGRPVVYRAAGSHAMGFRARGVDAPLDRWNGTLATVDGGRLRLVPADTVPALRLRYHREVVPPWRKRLWRDPEAGTTGG
jgi:hypothetical protein